jgi:hypothetical protein
MTRRHPTTWAEISQDTAERYPPSATARGEEATKDWDDDEGGDDSEEKAFRTPMSAELTELFESFQLHDNVL